MSFLSTSETWAVVATLGVALYGAVRMVEDRKWAPLPPGPPRDPFIGHLRHLPQDNQPEVFAEWGRIYGRFTFTQYEYNYLQTLGDIIYLGFPGNSILVLNSVKAAHDLLEVRSSNYS